MVYAACPARQRATSGVKEALERVGALEGPPARENKADQNPLPAGRIAAG